MTVEYDLTGKERNMGRTTMTQTARVLRLLTDARTRNDGVCCTVFLNIDQRIPRAAARVSELRAGGYLIDTEPCNQHFHRTKQSMYRLVAEPGEPLAFDLQGERP